MDGSAEEKAALKRTGETAEADAAKKLKAKATSGTLKDARQGDLRSLKAKLLQQHSGPSLSPAHANGGNGHLSAGALTDFVELDTERARNSPATLPAPGTWVAEGRAVDVPAAPRGQVISAAGLAACLLLTSLVLLHGDVRVHAFVAFAVLFTVPGAALLVRSRFAGPLTAANVLALSVAVETAIALTMIWTGWWHPEAAAVALGLGSCALFLDDLRSPTRWRRLTRWTAAQLRSLTIVGMTEAIRSTNGAVVIIPASLTAWGLSLGAVDVSRLGQYGLLPALPIGWYAALAGLLGGAVMALRAEKPRTLVLSAYMAAIVVVLYGTVPAVSAVPQYSWVYKHIGVTRFLELHGHVNRSVDIYNRWPGFFAVSALASRVAGMPNPVAFAGWAEPVFAGLAALFVGSIAQTVVGSIRVAATAALLFILSNWVGQSLYAPQSLAFILNLFVLLLVLRHRSGAHGPIARFLVRAAEMVARRPQDPDFGAGTGRPPRSFAVIVLFTDAVLIPTHQLTPYMLLFSVACLSALGVMQQRWLLLPMLALTLGYLGWNWHYVEQNFGVFSSLNPFSNVQHAADYGGNPMPGIQLAGRAGRSLSFLMWLGALASCWWLARKALFRKALPLVALTVAPFAAIFGQNYGGEIALRVTLFTIPSCSILIAWGLETIRNKNLRTALLATALFATAAIFIPASPMGQAELDHISKGEVQASEALYVSAPPDSVLMTVGPNFPVRYGPRYDRFTGEIDDRPTILRGREFQHRPLGARDLPPIIKLIRRYSPHGYLVFSKAQDTYARMYRLTPRGALADLEAAVARSPRFRLWYRNQDAQIYQVLPVRQGARTLQARSRTP
jgi:hypothetical protein